MRTMPAHQIHNLIGWIGYGLWNGANISLVAFLRIVNPDREYISWITTEIVTILTGISVILAITLTIKKLFWKKK